MARKLTEEERMFIANMHQSEGKVGNEIIQAFKEQYGWIPAASTVTKYQLYKPAESDENDTDTEDDDDLQVITRDTRKQPEIYDFSDGNIEADKWEAIKKLTGKSDKVLFEQLQSALSKGYKKINMDTGVVEK